jgi:hypothetical protein
MKSQIMEEQKMPNYWKMSFSIFLANFTSNNIINLKNTLNYFDSINPKLIFVSILLSGYFDFSIKISVGIIL